MTRKEQIIFLLATSLFWAGMYTYPVLLSNHVTDTLLGTPAMAGLVVGSYGFTQMVLRLPLGIYSDIIRKRRPFMIMGMVAGMVAALGFVAVKTPGAALICRGLSGVAASTWVMFSVMYSAQFSQEDLTAAMGRLTIVQYAPQLLGMLIGGFLAQWISRDVAFLLGAASGLAGVVTTSMIKDTPSDAPPLTLRAFASVAKNKRLIFSTLLSALFHIVVWSTVLGFTANWAKDVIGAGESQLGILSAMYLLPNVVLPQFTTGFLARKMGVRGVVTLGFLVAALACALFGHTYNIIALFLVTALFGVGMTMILPFCFANAVSGVEAEKRGAAMGFYQSIYSIGMFVGPVLAGGVIEWFGTEGITRGYMANFYLMAGICAAGAVLAALLWTKKRMGS